jgi:hypothetical protein
MKHFPIGFDNFAELVQKHKDGSRHHYFVDKSLLIRDILSNNAKVLLFTRPRRFGKTMNMSMLSYFFDIREATQNENLFTELKIASATIESGSQTELCMNYQGKYPVVFLTFKDCGYNTFQETYVRIKRLINRIYKTHGYLLDSNKLTEDDKESYRQIIRGVNDVDYDDAIRELTRYLHLHYNQKVIVIIDEYDTPFQAALFNNYYTQLLPIMKTLIGGVLKGNDSLEKAVLTGILRISGAGIFSGANNVRSRTILNHEFSEYFGFTESEISNLLSEMNRVDKLEELRNWYDGYQFGNTIIYNPWSVMECVSQNFDFSAHWVNTSDDKLLKEQFLKAPDDVRASIGTLVANESIPVVVYDDLRFDSELSPSRHIWTLLLSAGYLKSVKTERSEEGAAICQVEIPNREIKSIYRRLFAYWLKEIVGEPKLKVLVEYLLTGEAEEFCSTLQSHFLTSLSDQDVRKDRIESFYHGYMYAILDLSLESHIGYLESNKEGGLGYFDLMLEPRNPEHRKYNVGTILEFKRTNDSKTLSLEAKKGLEQIKRLQYVSTLRMRGVNRIIVMGIAFCGKEISYAFERLHEPQATLSTVQLMTQRANSPIIVGTKREKPELSNDQEYLQEAENRLTKQQKLVQH